MLAPYSRRRAKERRRFETPRPLLARLTAPPGPAVARLVERAGASVMAVPGRCCVTYVIAGSGGVAVVDVGSRDDVGRILAALDWLGRRPSDVLMVIPTHLHFDHILGVDAFTAATGAPVALGRVAFEHVTTGRPLRFPQGLRLLRAIPTWVMQGMPLELDVLTRGRQFGTPGAPDRFAARLLPPLDDGAPLPGFPGWTVLATPGHADDAICLYHEEAGFLVAGDTVRNFLGGEWNQLVADDSDFAATRERLRRLPVSTVFPGHGPIVEGPWVLRRLRALPWFVP